MRSKSSEVVLRVEVIYLYVQYITARNSKTAKKENRARYSVPPEPCMNRMIIKIDTEYR